MFRCTATADNENLCEIEVTRIVPNECSVNSRGIDTE